MFASQKRYLFQTPSSIVYERKFDTALRDTIASSFSEQLRDGDEASFHSLSFAIFRDVIPKEHRTTFFINFNIYPEILLDTLDLDAGHISLNSIQSINKAHKLSSKTIEIQLDYIIHSLKSTDIKKGVLTGSVDHFEQRRLPQAIFKLHTIINELDKLVNLLPTINPPTRGFADYEKRLEWSKAHCQWKSKYLNMSCYWSNNLCFILYKHILYINPRPYILMMHNKMCDLMSVLLLSWAQTGLAYEITAYNLTQDLVRDMAMLAVRYKDKFYDIAKSLESLVIGETLKEVDGWENDEFLNSTARDLYEATRFRYIGSQLQKILTTATIPLRHELGCLSKLFGHPFVNMEEGSKALHKEVTRYREIDYELLLDAVRIAKKSYIKNHILRYGKWPPVEDLADVTPRSIRMALILQRDPDSLFITKKYGTTSLEQYDFIILGPNMKFNRLENYIPYLKDKTISVLRSRVVSSYLSKPNSERMPKWVDTRLLLVYLLNKDIVLDHTKFLDKYTYSATLDEMIDYLVIRIVPKEKELKTVFRGFGCKTYEDRARTLAQEKNAMNFLEEYCPEQAMTLDELQLARKLHAFRSISRAYIGYTLIIASIDVSKWNTGFDDDNTQPINANTLDKVFDYPIYSKTHTAYHKALVYVPDILKNYSWDGQGGGVEGQNQDTWVWDYINHVKAMLKDEPCPIHYLDKGDDLRIAVLVPPDVLRVYPVPIFKNMIMEALSAKAESLGHRVKVLDSYGSTLYFAFSKAASVGSIELPQSFRKIQKCYGANNAFLPTYDEYIASTYSNAHSASKVSVSPISCYFVAMMWQYIYELSNSHLSALPNDALITLSLVPNLLGGFPVIFLHNFFVRAESDLLSPFIGLLQHCTRMYPSVGKFMIKFVHQSYEGDIKGFKVLLSDPYALPIKKPTTPTTLLRTLIRPHLERLAQNETLKELFKCAKAKEMDALVEALFSCNVYNAKILSTTYASSPEGLVQEFIRKFESSRSLHELLILRIGRNRADNVLRRIIRSDIDNVKYRVQILTDPTNQQLSLLPEDWESKCPAEVASNIRSVCYGKEVEGLTMPPLQHQIYVMDPNYTTPTQHEREHHFTYKLLAPTIHLEENSLNDFSSANLEPFLGHTTKAGTTTPSVRFVEKDVLLSKVKDLLDMMVWSNTTVVINDERVTSNYPNLISKILSMYLQEPAEQLSPFAGSARGGTVQHHVRSRGFRESIIPNMLSNFYQRIVGESNTHLFFRLHGDHYTINFLHIFCYVTSLLHLSEQLKKTSATSYKTLWAVTQKCTYCLRELQETPIIYDHTIMEGIEFHPIKATRIDALAEDIVRDSLTKFETKRVKDPLTVHKEIDTSVACIGALQEFCDASVYSRKRLTDCYSSHLLSDASLNIISQLSGRAKTREITHFDIGGIPYNFYDQVITQQVMILYSSREKCLSSIEFQTLIFSLPPATLPWFPLVQVLYKSGNLGHYLIRVSGMSSSAIPASYDSPESSSPFIGYRLYLSSSEIFKDGVTLVHLSYYLVDDLVRHARAATIILLYVHIIPLMEQVLKVALNANSIILVRRQVQLFAIIWATYTTSISRVVEEQEITLNKDIVLSILDPLQVDFDEFETWCFGAWKDDSFFRDFLTNVKADFIQQSLDFLCTVDVFDLMVNEVVLLVKEQKVTVVSTDLASCILTVKNIKREPLDLIERVQYMNEEILFPVHRYKKSKRHCYMKRFNALPTDSDIPLTTSYTDLSSCGPRLTLSQCHSCLGIRTNACNKIIELFDHLHIYKIPRESYIACLADGYGGILGCIANMTNDSVFLYNTLPEDLTVEHHAYNALDHTILKNNQIDDKLINEGICDLTERYVIESLMDTGRRYNLVTCDAEFEGTLTNDRIALVNNVLTFFKFRSTRRSCLILRMTLHESELLYSIVASMSTWVGEIILFRPSASEADTSFYMIALKDCIVSIEKVVSLKKSIPNAVTNQQITKFMKNIVIQVNLWNGNLRPTRFGLHVDVRYLRLQAITMPPIFLSHIIQDLHWHPAPIQSLLQGTQTVDKYTELLTLRGLEFINVTTGTLTSQVLEDIWDTGTHSHWNYIMEIVFRNRGFVDCLLLIKEDGVYDEALLHIAYKARAFEAPRRLQWYPVRKEHLMDDYFLVKGFTTRPFWNYIRGARTALRAYSYLYNVLE